LISHRLNSWLADKALASFSASQGVYHRFSNLSGIHNREICFREHFFGFGREDVGVGHPGVDAIGGDAARYQSRRY
jgi:hypothetical protein